MPWCWILIVTEPYEFAVHEGFDETIGEVTAGLRPTRPRSASESSALRLGVGSIELPTPLGDCPRPVPGRLRGNSPREKVATIAQ
jgi:hypothetical protein